MPQRWSPHPTFNPNCSIDQALSLAGQLWSGVPGNDTNNTLAEEQAESLQLHMDLLSSLGRLNIPSDNGLDHALNQVETMKGTFQCYVGTGRDHVEETMGEINNGQMLARDLRLALLKTIDTRVVLTEGAALTETYGWYPPVAFLPLPQTLSFDEKERRTSKWRLFDERERVKRSIYHQRTLSKLRDTLYTDTRRFTDVEGYREELKHLTETVLQEYRSRDLQWPWIITDYVENSIDGLESWLHGAYRSDMERPAVGITEDKGWKELEIRTGRLCDAFNGVLSVPVPSHLAVRGDRR
ncbi:hypothetical protein M231_01862 [Tremella mesenterica]|uniref:Uncharacterized protein n=1 Tax=Tremella mesenterica TaxID=5217 RepID=A0A4Q1BS34_TREME|nr:hypothetical protein M231_01862 [Tremella mesenterica]